MVELANDEMVVTVLNLGASLWKLRPTSEPEEVSLCLFHDDPARYAIAGRHMGVTVGPFANRIANSAFSLGGTRFELDANEGPHSLHGGPSGFGQQFWTVDEANTGRWGNADYASFDIFRPDGQGGYPGDLSVSVTWKLEDMALSFTWTAQTSAPTPVSITNHAYWNLGGEASIRDHELQVEAPYYVETDDALIPTGELVAVDQTPFDMQSPRRVGDVMDAVPRGGLDDCYVFDGIGNARLVDPATGRSIELVTSMPGVQVYTADDGICLETQHLPDAPNHDGFPSAIVTPGETARYETQYRFGFDA